MDFGNGFYRYNKTASSLLDAIGNTPLVELTRLFSETPAKVFAKLEYFNPTGSIKDRIVKHIIRSAEVSGELSPGGTIIESTSGNTGAAVAMIAASRGYRAILTMPDKVSKEKQDALTALGAEIVVCPTSASPGDPNHYVNKAKEIAAEIPSAFRLDQYNNPKNVEAHYLGTGAEIWRQLGGDIDYFVASGSTGGTITGCSKILKELKPGIKSVMPDLVGSIYFDFFYTGQINMAPSCTYHVEGVGEDHLVDCIDFGLIDEVLQFRDYDAFTAARSLALTEGILAGGSAGANIWGCMEIARGSVKNLGQVACRRWSDRPG